MDLLNLLATARDEDAFYVALAEGLRGEFGECRIEIVVAPRDKPSPQFASLTDPLPEKERE